ncbi:MAG: amidohydrolase [Candidatus Abyssobacteria bacterium SURF_5]|jgi:predicted TIM-barrel fold metal-dependent hydrolase|uniref:Amidohydrolase n=1 Tax=Abyssobacteria bacterium (strain SURF_5) TaxID=2093360 RepID=A0A3A4NTL3_ABYX5|nr:MAG: amidohydrolase [Candidatus Abyssubacteria bacterium SURF_5]
MIVDFHIHPFCKEATVVPSPEEALKRMYGEEEERFGPLMAGFRWIFTEKSLDAIIHEMDGAGIDKAVIVAADYSTAYGTVVVTNEDVERMSRQHPDRFVPFCSVDPGMGRLAVDRLEHAVREQGARGLKLVPPMQGFRFDDPRHDTLWKMAAELGIIVWTHASHQRSTPGTDARLGQPMLIEGVALKFPKLKIVLGHCGFPWVWESWSLAARHENVYVDISSFKDLYSLFPWDAYSASGIEHKLLFATDNPLNNFGDCVNAVKGLSISDSFKEAIFGGNAQKLLGL